MFTVFFLAATPGSLGTLPPPHQGLGTLPPPHQGLGTLPPPHQGHHQTEGGKVRSVDKQQKIDENIYCLEVFWCYIYQSKTLWNIKKNHPCLHCPPRNHAGVSATGTIRPNIKFADFWCVFLTTKKSRS